MKAELLAPAGNPAKFASALYFGADAVYIGGKAFSLRSFADNFSESELSEAVSAAHAAKKKVYVAVNIFARNADFSALSDYFRLLEKSGADAAIVSDPGVVYAARKAAPSLSLHLSTQANTTNKYAVKFWAEEGISRVILARELSVKEISEIRDFVPEMQLEAFVHGAMCISYSGRCLLSDYLDGRPSNRGACVQACRREYALLARPSDGSERFLPVQEDGRGTYILNSKDLNLFAHLSDLERAGVDSFKIEGRMKSEYYLATVINAYRRAMDGEDVYSLASELDDVAHREYTAAYAFGDNAQTVGYENSQTKGKCTYIANVLGSEEGFVLAEMRNRFRKGDVLEVLSPGENFRKSFRAERILDKEGAETEDARLVQGIYRVSCPYSLSEGDILRRREG